MKSLTLSMLAAAAITAFSIGGASAMPFSTGPAASESLVQDVRVVCDRNGRCYNTNRNARSNHYGSSHRYRSGNYRGNSHRGHGHYGHDRGPRVGVGVGPVGVGVQIR